MLYGVGGAGLVAGVVAGILSASKTSTLKDSCPGKVCGPNEHAALSGATTTAWISNIGIGVAVLGGALGTFSLLADRRAEAERAAAGPARIAPVVQVGSTGAFLGVQGRL